MAVPAPVWAQAAPDFDLKDGRFYTQTAPSGGGYSVTDADGVRFWSVFQRLGGPAVVGYPVSRRFVMNGIPTQAFQRLVFEWRGDAVVFANVFDLLSAVGKDDWLLTTKQVPRSRDWKEDTGDAWSLIVARHLALLDQDTAIARAYRAAADPIAENGLPMAAQDFENVFVLRAQRKVFQRWKVDLPWAKAGEVTVANGGEVAREAGFFPFEVVHPEGDPRVTPPPAPPSAALPRAAQAAGAPASPAGPPGAAAATPTPATDPVANRDAIAQVNMYRAMAGVLPLASDTAVARAAQAHADWLNEVGGPAGALFSHDEWPGSPRFTGARPEDRMAAAGWKGCCAAEYTWGYKDKVSPGGSVDGWMGGTIHRTFMIHPGVTRAGFGIRLGDYAVAVLDMSLDDWTGPQQLVVYPVPGQKDVPAVMEGAESPGPIPGRDDGFGYPITVIPYPGWPSSQSISLTKAWIRDSKGTDLTFATQYQRSYAVHLVAYDAFKSFETYTVHVEGTGSTGVAFDKTWSFTTGRAIYRGKPLD
jgi:uncharacterized protein YkwD